ncbi:MAG: DUF2147 domain-containing protein [Rhodoblastus sp.]
MLKATFTALALISTAMPAFAAEPYGVWRRPQDGTTFSFFRCGAGLCIKVKSVANPADRKYVGALIFSGATKSGPNTWEGRVKNLEDGHVYNGKIQLTGPRSVTLNGCVLGGAVCDGETWTRIR